MVAAIYARKSTSQSDVADVEKSVSRQIALARAFASERKWPVIEEYIDDGVSGQESAKLTNRARMLADATAGKFEVVIVRDYDRISRDDREGPAFVYMLADAGVQVFEYTSRAPIKVERAMDRTMLNMKAGFAAHEAEAASSRTREKKFEKAARGAIADGRVLGYRTVGELKSRRREIDPEQAGIVRRIFQMAADGAGLLKIARRLNEAGVVNPTGQVRTGKGAKSVASAWSTGGIREMLRRELYVGRIVYGRTRNARRGGKRLKIAGDAPITVECPELRIVSDELWNAVRGRQEKTRAAYLRRNGGQIHSRPEAGLESRYLLSGFVRCAECQGSMTITKRTGKRGRPQLVYVCSVHKTRGDGGCTMKSSLPVTEIDTAVVQSLREALTQERLEHVIQSYVDHAAAEADQAGAQRAALVADVERIERELTKLGDAVAGGGAVETLLGAIKAREAERRGLQGKLQHLDTLAKASSFDRATFAEGVRAILKSWDATVKRAPAEARRALRDVGVEAVLVTRLRDEDEARGNWSFAIQGSLATVLGILLGTAGFRPVNLPEVEQVTDRVCPRGDSNTRHAV